MTTYLSPGLRKFIEKNKPKERTISLRKAKAIVKLLPSNSLSFYSTDYFIFAGGFCSRRGVNDGDRGRVEGARLDLPIIVAHRPILSKDTVTYRPMAKEAVNLERKVDRRERHLSDYQSELEKNDLWSKMDLFVMIIATAQKLTPTLYHDQTVSLPEPAILLEIDEKSFTCFESEADSYLYPLLTRGYKANQVDVVR